MFHAIVWHGQYELNYERLLKYKGDPSDYKILQKTRPETSLDPISQRVNGIVFGYMQKVVGMSPDDYGFFAVKVDDVAVQKPIKIIPEIHTDGKGFGPNPSLFGDESAKRLLKDIIKKNRKQRKELMATYKRMFG